MKNLALKDEIFRKSQSCLICDASPCRSACPHGFLPDRMLRSVFFENEDCAGNYVRSDICAECEAPCENACINPSIVVPIKEIATKLPSPPLKAQIDLSVEFCSIKCENPFFLGSSVVTSNFEMCDKAFNMGWGGIYYKTISAIDIKEISPRFSVHGRKGFPFLGFRNMEQLSERKIEENAEILKRLKEKHPTKIIIASIMGRNEEEWEDIARIVTQAGVDAIECNFSCPQMTSPELGSAIGEDKNEVMRCTKATRKGTHLPIIAKMTPNVAYMDKIAIAAISAGADAISAINTVKSLTAFSLDNPVPSPSSDKIGAVSGLSGRAVKPIAQRFIAEMKKAPELKDIPISGIGGIYTWRDAAEYLMLGATNLQVVTSVMEYGYRVIDDLIEGLSKHLALHGAKSISEIIGRSLSYICTPEEIERETISYPQFKREKCIGCGRCALSCYDGGHQALSMNDERRPILNSNRCVGCHLCLNVCPTGAILASKRIKKI